MFKAIAIYIHVAMASCVLYMQCTCRSIVQVDADLLVDTDLRT